MELHVTVAGTIRGPFTEAELRTQLARGELALDTPARCADGSGWQPLGSLLDPAQPPPLPRKKSPRSAWLSWSAALLAIGLAAGSWLAGQPAEGAVSGVGNLQNWIAPVLHILAVVLAVVGLLFGIASVSQRTHPRRVGGFGLAVNILVLAGAVVFLKSSLAGLRLPGPGRSADYKQAMKAAQRPIPVSPGVRTRRDFQPTLRSWYERNWLESYLTHGHRSPQWDEAGTNLIRAWISQRVDASLSTSEEMLSDFSEQVLAARCDDPLLLALCAYAQSSLAESLSLAERAHQGFTNTLVGSRYPAVVRLRAKVNYARYLGRNQSRRVEVTGVERSAIPLLKQALRDGSFRREETGVFPEWLKDPIFEAFFERNSEAICGALDEDANLEPWLAPYLRGRHFIAAAWSARGSGISDTVTSEGWRGFTRHLGEARSSLATAWRIDPHQPATAVAMMSVQLGTGDAASMRDWFDKAVLAELDYAPAYISMRWGLRPRWHGSHEAMLAFGEACLGTKRFDTDLPFHYLNALRDVVSELGETGDAVYADPGVYRNLRAMYDGYLKVHTNGIVHDRLLSDRAIAAYLAGRLNECRQDLEVMQFKLLPEAVRRWPKDYSDIPEQVAALTSPAKEWVERGELDRAAHRATAALTNFRRAAELTGNDRWAARFVRRRVGQLEVESALERGQPVAFLPEPDFTSWKAINCAAERRNDGAWEIQADAGGYRMFSLARIGQDFEITGEVEFIQSENGTFQGGVVLGHPESDWWTFRFVKRSDTGRDTAGLSRKWTAANQAQTVNLGLTNTFGLRSLGGRITASLNGQQVFNAVAWPVETFGEPREIGVGLGAYSASGMTVRYRNVKLRRLP